MKTWAYWCLLVAGIVAEMALSGCGGSEDAARQPREAKIVEYVGDGHGGTKPDPLSLLSAQMQTRTVPLELKMNMLSNQTLAPGQVSWFRLPTLASNRNVIVTCQQQTNHDTDLYVLRHAPYDSDDSTRAYSDRLPTLDGPDVSLNGVPDWVYVALGAAAEPAGQVAIHAPINGDAELRPYRLELNPVVVLQPDAAPVHNFAKSTRSRWYRFHAQPGKLHTVTMWPAAGSDPDLFLYKSNSRGFVMKDTSTSGTVELEFVPTNDAWYFLRVFGWGNTNANHYDLQLTTADPV